MQAGWNAKQKEVKQSFVFISGAQPMLCKDNISLAKFKIKVQETNIYYIMFPYFIWQHRMSVNVPLSRHAAVYCPVADRLRLRLLAVIMSALL